MRTRPWIVKLPAIGTAAAVCMLMVACQTNDPATHPEPDSADQAIKWLTDDDKVNTRVAFDWLVAHPDKSTGPLIDAIIQEEKQRDKNAVESTEFALDVALETIGEPAVQPIARKVDEFAAELAEIKEREEKLAELDPRRQGGQAAIPGWMPSARGRLIEIHRAITRPARAAD